MKIHDLIQGTPEWHAYRNEHNNASDAPAMMGCSPYKTREQLLRERYTGLTAEVDAGTQRRFDDGHRFEALARPLAEKIIGQDLYPVVGSNGQLSASFDGLTLMQNIAFEHKSLNDELRAIVVDGAEVELPLHYQVQMEQQCMVSGAERVLFMATKWNGDSLVEARHCWYKPNPELADAIRRGWAQFAEDLANYTPTPTVVEAVGRTPETLPALRIEVTGMVTASNLDAFKAHALAVFQGINTDLQDDQQFADAEKTVKWCADVEDALAAAKRHALSQTESIDALFRAIDEIAAEARAKRLELDKLVKARKESIRGEIMAEGMASLQSHIKALNERLGKPYMPKIDADFAGAMRSKRTVSSLREAVNATLANAKIEASAAADRIELNLQKLRAVGEHTFLFADESQLVLKAPDDLALLIQSRIDQHTKAESEKLEAERERIRSEEAARLQREQESATSRAAVPATNSLPVEPAKPATVTPLIPKPALGARIKLGQINERLAPISITADGLASLGFEPVGNERAAKLYLEDDFPQICSALIKHITLAAAPRAA